MDEDNANEEQATSSRKESQRVNPGEDSYEDKKKYEDRHDSYDEKRKYDERRKYNDRGADAVSNSESFTSSYSARSRIIEVTEANANVPKPPGAKRDKDSRERPLNPKKKRTRHSGKVQKRGRSGTRRRVLRKAPRRKPKLRKDRAPSVSTIFTRLSSRTIGSQHEGEHEHGCNFCGHRCCRRR